LSLLLTLIISQEPSSENAAFYLLAHQWYKYALFFMSKQKWWAQKKKQPWRAAAGNSFWNSNLILKLSCITKTFNVNFSDREKPAFSSVRRNECSHLWYEKEHTNASY
jgi:hypothetical protein